MTRYTREHKQQTHDHIVRAASHAFRAEGIAGVSIPKLMGQVGLTHGGFYAHFATKDALVAAASAEAFREAAEEWLTAAQEAAPGEEFTALVTHYLSAAHRDSPATGCAIPTLAAEIARESPDVRHAYTTALNTFVGQIAPFMRGETEDAQRDAALALFAAMAGAMLLARAVDDPALSDHILAVSRQAVAR